MVDEYSSLLLVLVELLIISRRMRGFGRQVEIRDQLISTVGQIASLISYLVVNHEALYPTATVRAAVVAWWQRRGDGDCC